MKKYFLNPERDIKLKTLLYNWYGKPKCYIAKHSKLFRERRQELRREVQMTRILVTVISKAIY